MTARYGIYYAPTRAPSLWHLASTWLGRDAETGGDVTQPVFAELADVDFARITRDPRHYGFHATLKAPFALAADSSESALLDAARSFASARAPFRASISPQALGRFLAFRLDGPSTEMDALHADCVRHFEPFRRPLTLPEIERRRASGLSKLQDDHLIEWGYPFIFESFRFHMTLTGGLDDDELKNRVLKVAQRYFAEVTVAHKFDAICVFRQLDRESPFTIVDRFPFGGH
jgi:putative phosphonate metabolism protein